MSQRSDKTASDPRHETGMKTAFPPGEMKMRRADTNPGIMRKKTIATTATGECRTDPISSAPHGLRTKRSDSGGAARAA